MRGTKFGHKKLFFSKMATLGKYVLDISGMEEAGKEVEEEWVKMVTLWKYVLDISGMEEAEKEAKEEQAASIIILADKIYYHIKKVMFEKKKSYLIKIEGIDYASAETKSAVELILKDNPRLSIDIIIPSSYDLYATFLVSLREN